MPSSARSLPALAMIVIVITMCSCAPTLKQIPVSESAAKIEAEKQREMALELWVKRQERLASVSYRLTRSSAELCSDKRVVYGFIVHDVSSYSKEYREAAVRHFALGTWPVVRYVEPAFPAATAGLQPGDSLEAINGRSIEGKTADQAMKQLFAASSTKDSVEVQVRRKGELVRVRMLGIPACDYSVQATDDDIVNAYADGENVYIASGMMRFAETDDELALVVGHELSHNALGHVSKKKSNALLGAILDVTVAATTGINTGGAFSDAGGKAFSQAFESEADYEGLYMAARAGFDISNAPNFWRRMAAEHPGSIKKNFSASHPSTPERFIALENAVAEIQSKKEAGLVLAPDKKSDSGNHDEKRIASQHSVQEKDAQTSTVPEKTSSITKPESDAAFRITMEGGEVISCESIQPWGSDLVKAENTGHGAVYLNSSRIKTIVGRDGHDWTKDVLSGGKRLPRN